MSAIPSDEEGEVQVLESSSAPELCPRCYKDVKGGVKPCLKCVNSAAEYKRRWAIASKKINDCPQKKMGNNKQKNQ